MDNSLTSKISFVRSKLVSDIKANVQEDWLKECVSYFVQTNPAINNNQLYNDVKDQFCLANISDTSHGVLPGMFTTKKDPWTLKESLLLQMQYILDISDPFYDQWRRLHDKKLDEVIEDNRETKTFHSKKKRMFKLQLTDGYKTVSAMEMKHIACLNTKLTPGIKILIVAPVPVVNQIIQIKPENVKIIGGEVEELIVVNAYENVLLRLLKKPTTQNPVLNYSEPTYENEKAPNNIPKNLVRMDEQSKNQQNHQKQNKPLTYIDDIDDEGFDFAMIDAIEEQERKKSQEQQLNASNMIIDDDDDYILAQIDLEEIQPPNIIQQREMSNGNRNQQNVIKANDLLRLSVNLIDEDSDMIDMELENVRKRKSLESPESNIVKKSIRLSPIKKPQITDKDYPFKVDETYNFITIDQYVGMKMRDKMEGEYALEVSVEKVLKIKANDAEWILIVQIKDPYSQNTISVRFIDEIVTEFAGRTAREINVLKRKMDSGQPQLKMDITETLAAVNDSMQNRTFILCIQMMAKLPAEYENVIKKVLKKTDENKQMIALKIEQENIALV